MTASPAPDSDPTADPKVTAPAATDPEPGADKPVPPESAKEVFAAALAKKKAAGAARSAHLDAHGGVGGATASHKTSRTFRRKSG